MAYALLIDRDLGDDRFEPWDRQLLGLPAIDVGVVEEASEEAPSRWDPETWGTTAEAQDQLVRALEIIGA